MSDFGADSLVTDALSVIEASGVQQVMPVAVSHAGWIAIELRRRLAERIPKLVLVDWIILEPPPPFVDALRALQDPQQWEQAREQLFSVWLQGVDNAEVIHFVRGNMGSYGFDMWARGSREIFSAYTQAGSPLQELARLNPPVPVLHLYTQPEDPGYLAAQQSFAAEHPWFSVRKLAARSHFPVMEVPNEVAAEIELFGA